VTESSNSHSKNKRHKVQISTPLDPETNALLLQKWWPTRTQRSSIS